MNTKHPLQIYLDTHDQVLLDQLATRLGLSKAETMRAALRRWALDASGEGDAVLQLIGSLDDPLLPPDLSTLHDAYAVQGHPVRPVAEPPPPRKRR